MDCKAYLKRYEKSFPKSFDPMEIDHFKMKLFSEIKRVLDVPDCIILIFLNQHIAHMAGTFRAHFQGNHGTAIPINYYSLLFMDSGGGKDSADSFIQKLFTPYYIKVEDIYKDEHDYKIRKLENELLTSTLSKKERSEYKKTQNIKRLQQEYSDGTLEGLHTHAVNCDNYRRGGLNIKCSEFGSYLQTYNENKQAFIENGLIEIYDVGKLKSKMIKTISNNKTVSGIFCNFHAHTSTQGLKKGKPRKTIEEMLMRGFLRRTHIGYPETKNFAEDLNENELEKEFLSNQKNKLRISYQMYTLLETHIADIFQNYRVILSGEIGKEQPIKHTLQFEKDAYILARTYEIESKRIAVEKYSYSECMNIEWANKHWKMLKLAGLNAFIGHPQDKTIKLNDVKAAIHEVEFFGQYIHKLLISDSPKQDFELIFEYLVSRTQEKGGASLTEIRGKEFTPNQNKFRSWWQDVLPMVEDYAESKGYTLEFKKGERNKQIYYVEKIINIDLEKVRVSKSMETSPSAVNFEPLKISWSNFYAMCKIVRKYSNFHYHNNYRNQGNSFKECDFIMLDFDNGQTIKEIEEKLASYQYFIQPSTNHLLVKNDEPARERFHVHILLKTPMKVRDNEHYKNIINNICESFGFNVDKKCHEIARYFNTSNNQIWYGPGKDLLDWKLFDYVDPEPIQQIQQQQRNVYYGNDSYSSKLQRYEKSVYTYLNNNFYKGNRNQALFTIYKRGIEGDGIDRNDVIKILSEYNKNSGIGLTQREFNVATREN